MLQFLLEHGGHKNTILCMHVTEDLITLHMFILPFSTQFIHSTMTEGLLRSKGLKDVMCMGGFGNDWDCSVGSPPEAMIT